MNLKHVASHTPEYRAYISAIHRCRSFSPEIARYYRNRGIKFSFVSFDEFFKDLGKKPNGSTLDRIKNDGNYEPGNVRWATHRQQMLNRRERLFCFRGHPFIPENTFTYKNGNYIHDYPERY